MIVDPNKMPVLWTTCDKSKDRWDEMETELESISIKGEKIVGPITNPYPLGVAKGYMTALQRYSPPFMILEDDARLVNPGINLDFYSLPDKADALYLGTSICGRFQNKTLGNCVITSDNGFLTMRVYNMLSFHAIIYLSQHYVDCCLERLEQFIVDGAKGGADDCIADNMWKHQVYSVRRPVFYQKDGRNERNTTIELPVLLV